MWKGGIRSTVYDDEQGEDQIDFSIMEMDLGSHIGQASGEGVPVVLSQHQVDGYRISSHARLILDSNDPYIKAGFLDDFRPNYEPHIEGSSFDLHMAAMEAYAEGAPCDDLIMRAYLAPPPTVVFESPAQPEASLVNILEKTALRQLSGDLCLLNPSMGTVWRALEEGKYFSIAYTAGPQNDDNRKRFENTFADLLYGQKYNYYPQLALKDVDPQRHYFCGMSGVHKWVTNGSGFDPNIFDPQFVSTSLTGLQEISGGVRVRHWRKDYEASRDWLYHPHYYRYSASSFMMAIGKDYKDSNYYQNELTAFLDRFFYCSTSLHVFPSTVYSPTPCGKVFFPVTPCIRVWWEGDRACPMYQYVDGGGTRYLVWVDMGFSYYSTRVLLQDIAAVLRLPLWELSQVPSEEFVLYPLTSAPTVLTSSPVRAYMMSRTDSIIIRNESWRAGQGYECLRCGVWQVGIRDMNYDNCVQCDNPGRTVFIGLGPDISHAAMADADRSPGRVVRMDLPGLCVVLLGQPIDDARCHEIRQPDIVIQEVPYIFNSNGSVQEVVTGIEAHDVPYVFWGKISDYPGKYAELRRGEWGRYNVVVTMGQARWVEKIKRRGSTKSARRRARLKPRYVYVEVVPQPRLLIRRALADWHDTTMHLTLASVPIMDWVSALVPRVFSSAKGVDDGRGGTVSEECEWL